MKLRTQLLGLAAAPLALAAIVATADAQSLVASSECVVVTGTGGCVGQTSPTITTPVIATIVNTGTLTLPTSTDTLVGRATTDTLTNKTLSGGTISGTIAGAPTASGAWDFTGNPSFENVAGSGYTAFFKRSGVTQGGTYQTATSTILVGNNGNNVCMAVVAATGAPGASDVGPCLYGVAPSGGSIGDFAPANDNTARLGLPLQRWKELNATTILGAALSGTFSGTPTFSGAYISTGNPVFNISSSAYAQTWQRAGSNSAGFYFSNVNSSMIGLIGKGIGIGTVAASGTPAAADLYLLVNGTAPTGGAIGDVTPGTNDNSVQLGVATIRWKALFAGTATLSALVTDATHTDTSVCADSTSGLLYKGSGTLGVCLGTSSARYKSEIADLAPGLEQILALRPVSYKLDAEHGDPAKPFYGFLAEEAQGVLPQLVGLDEGGRPNTFDYLGVVPVLVRAMQQQQQEIAELKAKLGMK